MERVLGSLSARKLDEELEYMVFKPLHYVDTDVASRAGLDLRIKQERYYCRVLQGQAVVPCLLSTTTGCREKMAALYTQQEHNIHHCVKDI